MICYPKCLILVYKCWSYSLIQKLSKFHFMMFTWIIYYFGLGCPWEFYWNIAFMSSLQNNELFLPWALQVNINVVKIFKNESYKWFLSCVLKDDWFVWLLLFRLLSSNVDMLVMDGIFNVIKCNCSIYVFTIFYGYYFYAEYFF